MENNERVDQSFHLSANAKDLHPLRKGESETVRRERSDRSHRIYCREGTVGDLQVQIAASLSCHTKRRKEFPCAKFPVDLIVSQLFERDGSNENSGSF